MTRIRCALAGLPLLASTVVAELMARAEAADAADVADGLSIPIVTS